MAETAAEAISTEIATIESKMGTDEYVRDEGLQARYRELVEAREGGGSVTPPSPLRNEIASIEKMMRNPRSAYWQDDRLQERYRELITLRESGGELRAPKPAPKPGEPGEPDTAPREAWRTSPAQARKLLDPQLAQDWDENGGFEVNLVRVQNKFRDIVLGLNDNAAADDFLGGFDGMSTAARTAVFREIARDIGYCPPASDAEVRGMQAIPGVRELLDHWGPDGRRKLGIAMTKFDAAYHAIPEGDRAQWTLTWQRLSDRGRQLVLWTLGE